MRRFAPVLPFLAGCLHGHTVEVDRESVDVPRGASMTVTVTIDGAEVIALDHVLWSVDDPELVTVTPAYDGRHLRIGGDLEGETIVHVNAHGVTVDVAARVGPPAIVQMWIEPEVVATSVGGEVPVRALALDTLARIHDVTHTSRWSVRDTAVANLDHAGMMLHANGEGRTTLHATSGEHATAVPITIFQ